MHRLIVMFLFCCLSAELHSQTSSPTVTGRVVDGVTGEPVEYANVVLYSARDSTAEAHAASGADGIFSLRCRHVDDYYIETSFVGYTTLRGAVFRPDDGNSHMIYGDVALQPANMELSEVEITGRKRQTVYKLDKKVIEAAGNIAADGGTAVDILSRTPSVRVDAEGEVTFRGSSGFKVYIDGKPATLEGGAALEQIPAGRIDNIEIITVPSARNEADGTAGIININTKRQTADGWSGLVNGTASSVASRGIDFLASYRRKNIRWQTSGEASRRYLVSDFDQLKRIDANDTLTVTHASGERKTYTDSYFLRTMLERDKGNTTWFAALESRYRIRHRGGHLHYDDMYVSGNDTAKQSFNGGDYVHLNEWTARGDAGFERRFSETGHKLTASLFAFYEGDAMEFFYTDLFYPDGSRAQGHRAWEAEYRLTAQANLDYVYPFNEKGGKFESGYYFFTYTEDGDYTIDFYQPAAMRFERRDELYNRYLFRRDIHAVYAMLSNVHAAFSYQAGLRGEYRYRKLGNNEAWARHVRNDFDLFPSAHLAYALRRGGRLNAAYSRRITQPQLFYMEPYVVYVDFYTAQRGNPMILPEYTNSFEFTWSKGFGDNSAAVTAFHRMRKDKIERVRVPYHTGVTLDSMANVGNDYSTGVEAATTFFLYRWWNMDINGSLYYYTIKNDYKTDGADEKSWNWQWAFNNNFDPGRNTRLRFEAYYVGPTVSTQGRVNEFFYFNLAVRQQMFKRKLAATLNIRDVFSTARYISSQTGRYLYSNTTIYPRSPLLTLSLSWTFNNFKSQKKEEKITHDLFEGTNR
ncbi:MAG: TonB-dependent receptor family protein [Bacteroidales bacterium]|nr:TonB-dependent receptor family protein [Bacteroidales bacterium]